ncbi:het-domain-containing protein [Fusarium flagelliforme]|uniref:Het-domain-containing protein n=1 Tax=Fusarium flagelliforme TaxID=2675880 RepID=A0A395N163_9HYPO|nr:het-domain-containing protein [Fusarium flagelliforme]
MDPSTSDFIIQKAFRYGLHSCSYCQAVLVDLTSLVHPGTKDDSFIDEKDNGSDDKKIALYYDKKPFNHFKFSREFVNEAALSCPLFELLKEKCDGDADLRINIDVSSAGSDIYENEKDGGKLYLRLSTSTCLSEHEKCRQTGIPPSRLLDVCQGKTKLVDTELLDDPSWAALSYCWGGPQKAQTTHLNIHDRYQEIDLDELPLTIRDAIYVCRQMHIPYLWVDSLCIAQTDSDTAETAGESDKDRELRKMAGIFSGAALTISASCASSAIEGFLHDRPAWPPGVALPLRVGDTHDIAQVVSTLRAPLAFEAEPVDSRAWIFQEQELSGRAINFRMHGVHWGCQTVEKFISPYDEWLLHSVAFDRSNCRFVWSYLVNEYSKRDLSDIRDRLIAIAAVAEKFANTSNSLTISDYTAGLLKPTLLGDLLWYAPYREDKTIKLEGPSWSWASITGPITYDDNSQDYYMTALLLSTDIVLADPNHVLGSAKSGRIRLRGHMTVESRRITPTIRRESSCERYKCHWDVCPDSKEVFLLEIALLKRTRISHRLGLMLYAKA